VGTSGVRMISWPLAALVAVAVLLLAVSPLTSLVVLGACVAAALIGPVYALQALAIATLINYASPQIIKLTPLAGALDRAVLLAALVRVLPLVRGADLRLIWPILLFGLLSALTSVATSPALEISIMKVITFTLVSSAVLIACGRIRAGRVLRVQTWFLTLGFSVIALSGLTLAKPGLGIGLDGGLQGLLNQPQALGIFIAPFAAWSLTGVLLMRRQASRLEVWMAIGTVILIILTRARTGAFAAGFAVALVMLARALGRRHAQQARLGRPMLIAGLVGAAILAVALTTGGVTKFVSAFAYKNAQQRNLGGAFYESRGGGVLAEWQHFRNSPWLGNGFGVYPDGKFPAGVVTLWGIPISAPIEKGFLPTAILEEAGLVGAAALALLIAWLARRAWRTHELRWRAMFIACLAVNVGECIFLSPGGIGLLSWLLMGLSLSAYRAGAALSHAAPAAAQPRKLPLEPGRLDGMSLPAATH
jgi:hypothetical protein